MDSGRAHGWLFVGLVNDHTRHIYDDVDEAPEGATGVAPCCCGPCDALVNYFNTPRGRAEAQTYLSTLSRQNREWVWAPGGVIDWQEIQRRIDAGWCEQCEGK